MADSRIPEAAWGLVGVAVGFLLHEVAEWIRRGRRVRLLRKALLNECRSLLAQVPDLVDVCEQSARSLRERRLLPGPAVTGIRTVYESTIEELSPHLSHLERNLLHVVHERVRTGDEMIANHAGEVLRALQEGLIDPWDVYATRFGEQVESYRLVEKMLRSFMDGRPIDVFHVGARGTMNEPEQKPMTLKVFIEENHRLISVIGVMAALLLFSWRIGDKPGGWISLCLSTCLMILTVELYAQLPGKGRSLRLAVFELGFFGALVGVFVYWLLLAEKHLRGMVLIFPAAFMIVFATYWLSEKTGLTRRKWMIRFRWIRPALALLILVAGFYLGGLVAFRYYAPLHGVLESVRGTLGLADVADSVATSRTVIEGAGPPQAPTPRVPAAASPR